MWTDAGFCIGFLVAAHNLSQAHTRILDLPLSGLAPQLNDLNRLCYS
jgi:hypothetical protein